MLPEIVATWYSVAEVDNGRPIRGILFPTDPETLMERLRARRQGLRTPEEEEFLRERPPAAAQTRDRRLVGGPVLLADLPAVRGAPRDPPLPPGTLRTLLLAAAEEALQAAWDPSIHVEEAVRAMADLDSVKNLVGERLVSWSSRDLSEEDSGPSADQWARIVLDSPTPDGDGRGPPEPEIDRGRRSLATLYESIGRLRGDLENAVVAAMPRRAPNLSALLGPQLAARLLSQAGGLGRLARLPASTVQVLGAERAFFEHLRGRGPPPRHGLLFLHPTIQGAPRKQRGKLARALAGKVAIAARMDAAGTAVRPELLQAFEARAKEVRRAGSVKAGRSRPRRSAAPLDRAPEDR